MSLTTVTEKTNAASVNSAASIIDTSATANVAKDHQADASASQKSSMGLANDFNSFVKMLVTQLKHQDPTNPMDSGEFTQQIVAFTGVEQAVATNKHLERLVKLNEGAQFKEAAMFVGKIVSYDSTRSKLEKGSAVNFGYNLAPDKNQKIESNMIKIFNSDGILMKQVEGSTKEGQQAFNWDGVDSRGKKSPEGEYHIKIFPVDSEGRTVKSGTPVVTGFVSETRFRNGMAYLVIDGQEVPLSRISSMQALPPIMPNNQPIISDGKQQIAPNMGSAIQQVFQEGLKETKAAAENITPASLNTNGIQK